jgi:hypothetical protein
MAHHLAQKAQPMTTPDTDETETCPTCGKVHDICKYCGQNRVICPADEPGEPFAWCEDCEESGDMGTDEEYDEEETEDELNPAQARNLWRDASDIYNKD